MKLNLFLSLSLSLCSATLLACEEDDPETTPNMTAGETAGETAGDPAGDSAGDPAGDPAGDSAGDSAGDPAGDSAGDSAGDMTPEVCEAPETDYPSDAWAMCISDDGVYELAGEGTPSSAARVVAYELIGDLLWRNASMTPEDFIEAELIYAEDGGVGSRVTRRYDAHLEKPEGADCAAEDAGAQWPEYCIGPAQIEPLILDAFARGISGSDLERSAAEVRAGLLWFYYVSVYKEAYTCAGKAADCDSHWAYHNGGVQRDEEPLGLAGEISTASEEAYGHIFDAHLAIRCWRDLDSATVSEDPELHAQALGQLDTALDYGYALMIAAQLRALAQAPDATGTRVMLSILGPTLTRALLERDPELEGAWSALWAELADESVTLSADTLSAAADQVESTFLCP